MSTENIGKSILEMAHGAFIEKRKARLRPFPVATNPDLQSVQTLCDVCQNACGKCEWSEKGVQKPVSGWDAIRRDVTMYGHPQNKIVKEYKKTESYVVLHCPKFVLEPHRTEWYAKWDPEHVRRKLKRGSRSGSRRKTTKVRSK